MLFKNLICYRLLEPFTLSAAELEERLSKYKMPPCPKTEASVNGWISPFGDAQSVLVHECDGYLLFCYGKEEKILPMSVVKQELQKKVAEIEAKEDRVVYRKERQQMKEEILFELRRQAFTRKKSQKAYLDLRRNLLQVDAPTSHRAEELGSFLRKTLGSLKLSHLTTKTKPFTAMNEWLLSNRCPSGFTIETNCDMLDPKQRHTTIKFRQQALTAKEVISHLHSGKIIVNLAMSWKNKIAFEFSDDLSFKKIRFLNIAEEDQKNLKRGTSNEQLDANFALMSGELSLLVSDVVAFLGGYEKG